MSPPTPIAIITASVGFAPAARAQQGQVNVICSVQADWCNMIHTVFAKSTGIKVNMAVKGSGEAVAQLIAKRANPKTKCVVRRTGDPHLQAAESNLTAEYKSAALPQLHAWAQQKAEQSHFKTVGLYSGPRPVARGRPRSAHRAPAHEQADGADAAQQQRVG